MNVIEVTDLVFSYGSQDNATPILKGLSLKVKKGDFVAIQGPSGSGKSTLLYLLGLLTTPLSGIIKINGQDVSTFEDSQKAQMRSQSIGFIFQHFHLLPKTSVLDNILVPTQYGISSVGQSTELNQSTDRIDRAHKLIDLVGLTEHTHKFPNQLSGGQQQRVAICRALIKNPDIILADEPTGNLDSVSAHQILELLQKLNRDFNKTIIIITHDNEVASRCDRIIRVKDGRVLDQNIKKVSEEKSEIDNWNDSKNKVEKINKKNDQNQSNWKNRGIFNLFYFLNYFYKSFPSALKNLSRNKTRSALNMIGISIGIAAIISMITLGKFTKQKILSGYEEMGVNSIVFYGYPNWERKAIDIVPTPFRYFEWERDLKPLKKIFPEIIRISPVLFGWDGAVDYGGRSIEQEIRLIGVNEDALLISKRELLLGRNFSAVEIEQKNGVCVIGYEVGERLFSKTYPIGQVLRVTQGDNSFGCRIIGVLKSTTSKEEYMKPNLQVYFPYTFFQALAGDWWNSQVKEVMIQTSLGSDVEKISKAIRVFFEQRYGVSGRFRVDSDTVLVAQMRRFLSLFTILLSSIAFVTLAVGGIGITNMMLVSVSERFREIGLRKALGATNQEIKFQFIVESIIICFVAGLIGLFVGFIGYQLSIWAASKFVSKLKFSWIVDWFAIFLSLFSILTVGILSGLFPAIKAEKLQVIDALRSE